MNMKTTIMNTPICQDIDGMSELIDACFASVCVCLASGSGDEAADPKQQVFNFACPNADVKLATGGCGKGLLSPDEVQELSASSVEPTCSTSCFRSCRQRCLVLVKVVPISRIEA